MLSSTRRALPDLQIIITAGNQLKIISMKGLSLVYQEIDNIRNIC